MILSTLLLSSNPFNIFSIESIFSVHRGNSSAFEILCFPAKAILQIGRLSAMNDLLVQVDRKVNVNYTLINLSIPAQKWANS